MKGLALKLRIPIGFRWTASPIASRHAPDTRWKTCINNQLPQVNERLRQDADFATPNSSELGTYLYRGLQEARL